jgi:hypothetical protein
MDLSNEDICRISPLIVLSCPNQDTADLRHQLATQMQEQQEIVEQQRQSFAVEKSALAKRYQVLMSLRVVVLGQAMAPQMCRVGTLI